MRRLIATAVVCACAAGPASIAARAAETWSEIKTPHFTVWSNAGDRAARNMTWQLEQIRSAMAAVFPWANVDPAKPIVVFVVKDIQSMRALAPRYWEQKGDIRPASVWSTGADRHYLVVRTDVRVDDNVMQNPYATAYFAYGSLIIGNSFSHRLPMWFSRGLAGIVSNMLVRDDYILLGAPIAWELQTVRERRYPLQQLLATTRLSPELRDDEGLRRFDAQSWAFVHLLLFGEQGAYQARLNRFAAAVNAGTDANAAFAEAIGSPDSLQLKFAAYIDRNIFSGSKVTVNNELKRERFEARPLSAAESAAGRAAFHVAMGRPVEARALIAEARAADPNNADAYVVEALQLEQEGKRDEARTAYVKAAELGTRNAWAHYRAAMLNWRQGAMPDADTLKSMEKNLARAVELQDTYASAYAALAEVRAALGQPQGSILPLLSKAIALEPASAWHRIMAARVLWRFGALDEARRSAESALAVAEDDEARQEAQRLMSAIPKK